jgi:hypothetical protein
MPNARQAPLPPSRIAPSRIVYPAQGYTGYGDGVGMDLTAFITAEMRADWEANRDELMKFWQSDEFTHQIPSPTACHGYLSDG